jgi:SAM-dependent methyltransferase
MKARRLSGDSATGTAMIPQRPAKWDDMPFTCNVCGQRALFQQAHYDNPELPSCPDCRSNVRFRWLVHRLSMEYFGRSVPLPEFPLSPSIVGLGLTDPQPIAASLERCFTYRNTYLTADPRLDIRFDPSPLGPLDFLIASEVFEHVEPPVMQAFQNAASLLRESGVLFFTSPWVWDGDPATAIPDLHDWKLSPDGDRCWSIVNRRPDGQEERFPDMHFDGSPGPSLGYTREHFPALHDWRLSNEEGNWSLTNTRPGAPVETFRNLVFHEGPGLALEMRLFTKNGIEDSLRAAGFRHIEFEMHDTPEFGIIFGYPWSRPVIARK